MALLLRSLRAAISSRPATPKAKTILSRLALAASVFALAPVAIQAQTSTTTTLTAPTANTGATYSTGATNLTATVSNGTANLTQGIVFFCDDISTGATAGACGNLAYLGQTQIYSGVATLKVRLGAGAHKLYAKYQPTVTYLPSTSATTAYTVSATAYPLTSDLLTTTGSAGSYTLTDILYGVRGVPLGTAAHPGSVAFNDTTTSTLMGTAQSITASVAGIAPVVTYPNGPPTAANIIVKGDFNNDGYTDLAIFSTTSTAWAIAYGNANGTFAAPVTQSITLSSTPIQAAVGDFLGAGYPSIVITTAAKTVVVLANASGTFTASTLATSSASIYSIGVGDFTLDGCLDIVTSASASPFIAVYPGASASGTCSGSLGATPVTSAGSTAGYGMVVADFNGDGTPDIAISGNTKLEVHTNVGVAAVIAAPSLAGTFNFVAGSTGYTIPNGVASGNPTGITAADLKGDGVQDIIYSGTGGVGVLLNNAGTVNGASVTPVANTTPFSTAAPASAYSPTTNSTVALAATPYTYTSGLYSSAANTSGLSGIAAGDFDGNGTVDVVAGSTGTVIYILNGDTTTPGTLDTAASYTSGTNPYGIAVADFAGTGSLDIATINDAAAATVSVFFPGQTATASITAAAPGAGPQTISATYTPSVTSYATTASNPVTLAGGSIATSTTLSTSPASTQTYGSSVTLTATVSAASTLVGGTVQFYYNGTAIGSAQTVNTTTGVATLATTALPPGSLSLTAIYSGSNPDEASTSPAVGFTVTEGATTGAYLAYVSPAPASSIIAGNNLGIVVIAEKDSNGNTIPVNGDTIKINITYGAGPTVLVSTTATTVNGIASIDLTGYPLLATNSTTATAYTVAVSESLGTYTSITPISNTVTTGLTPVYGVSIAGDDTATAGNCTLRYAGATLDTSCYLRDAIAAANATTNATVFIKRSLSTITLAASLQASTTSTNFFGYGGVCKVNGGTNKYTMFSTNTAGVNLAVTGILLNAAKGTATDGAAILMGPSASGTLTVNNVDFYQNYTTGNGGSIAIEGSGNATITNSTIYATASNVTSLLGGGVYLAGTGTTTISNTTFYLNTANKGGGAIYAASGTVNLIDDTIVGNVAATTFPGGGIYKAGPATVNLTNTVVEANSSATGTQGPDVFIVTGTGTYSATSSLANTNGGTSPYTLATLGLGTSTAQPAPPVTYGGPVSLQEFALLPGSPLLKAGVGSSSYPYDERGLPRPTSGAVDIGALQDNLSIAFTVQAPSAAQTVGVAITGSPAITLYENNISIQPSATSLSVVTGSINPGSLTSASSPATEPSGVFSNLIPATAGTAVTLSASAPVGSSTIAATSSVTFNINKTSSTTTLTPSTQTIGIGSSASVTATIASTGYTPTGTVNFFVDGSSTVAATCTLVAGACTASIPSLAVMASPGHAISATYVGDNGATTSSSTTNAFVIVTAQTSTVVLSPSTQTSTTGTATITATVSGGNSITPTGGTVTLTDSVTGSGPYTGTASAGSYSFNLTGLTAGTHSFTATYGGDASTAASGTSAAVTVVVNLVVASTTTYTGATTGTYGMPITLAATVTTASVVPTGTVTFSGTGITPVPSCMLTMASSTSATCSTAVMLPAGSYSITASYSTDGTSASSSSTPATTLTVAKATLTVTGVGTNRKFNAANALSYTVTGYAMGDTAATVFAILPTVSTTATRDTPAGTATVVPTAGTLSMFGAANYNTPTLVNGTFTITGGDPQSILFFPLANFASGHTYQLTARTTSGLPVTYTVTAGSASVSGTALTVSSAGTVTIQASTATDATGDYTTATPVSRSFTAQ